MKQLLRVVRNRLANQESAPAIPTNLSREIIGYSVQQRPIEVFRFGSGPNSIIFGSAIHGNEVGTVKLAHSLINWLTINHARFPNLSIFIIPVINPDGFVLAQQSPDYKHGGRIGRFNAHDVDLNRNFPVASFKSTSVWNRGKAYSETAEVYCGTEGGSELEIQALTTLCLQQAPKLLTIFHSVGPDILSNTISTSDQYAEIFSQHTGYPMYSEANWKQLGQTGTAKEWTEVAGVPYVEIETPSRYRSHWTQLQPAIEACLQTMNSVNL